MPNMNSIVNCLTPEPKSHSFVDTIHGLTDKLHQLSGLGHDDSKSKSGKWNRFYYVFSSLRDIIS